MDNKATIKDTPTGRRHNANAYPFRLIVKSWQDPTSQVERTFERLECGHVMQRPCGKDFRELIAKNGRRRCRECYQEGES